MLDILKKSVLLVNLIIFLSIIISVAAQEGGNETTYEITQANETSENFNEGNQTNTTQTTSDTEVNETTEAMEETEQETASLDEINATESTEMTNQTNATEEQQEDVVDFVITLTPTEVKQGDVILTVHVENNGTVALSNLIPLVTGQGFSSYDVVPIVEVAPGETAVSYVLGHFTDAGSIVFTIKINGKAATQTVLVAGTSQSDEELEALKEEALQTLSVQLEDLENRYVLLEEEVEQKKKNYLLPEMDIGGLKEDIRNAQSRILAGDVEEANISIILALTEYGVQKNKIDSAQKKSFFDKIQDNIFLISTLAGAILTLFAFFEFVKRKQAGIYQKIKEFKVDQNTKIEVHKKKETKDEDEVPKLDVWERDL